MVTCPVCGRQMRKGDLRLESFACPKCKTKLRLEESHETGLLVVGSVLLALLVTYLAGAQGYAFLLCAYVLSFVICGAAGAVRGFLFPRRLQRDISADGDGGILHLTGPPDPPKDE
jgi:hypothetical protein